jgi:hypothetical protein
MNMHNSRIHATDTPSAPSERLPSFLLLRWAGQPERPAQDSFVKGQEHETPENDRRRAGSRLAGGRLQQFPGAYLAEDVRAIRGADVSIHHVQEGLRS